MYFRWKRHERAGKWRNGKYEERWLLAASLVESQRVDGKPRQRTICYLGSIREDELGEVRRRRWFWEYAEARMDRAGISEVDRPRIAEAIEARVPRPGVKEMAADAEAEAKRWTEAAVLVGRRELLAMAHQASDEARRLRQTAGE